MVTNALAVNRNLTLSNTGKFTVKGGKTITVGAFAGSGNTVLHILASGVFNVNQSSDTNMTGTIHAFGAGANKGKLRKTGEGTLTISGTTNVTVENY